MDRTYQNLKRDSKNLNKVYQKIEFLKDCLYFNITPKFLRITNHFMRTNYYKQTKTFETKILKKNIRKEYAIAQNLKNQININKKTLESKNNAKIFEEQINKIKLFCEIDKEMNIKKHQKKLKFWLSKRKREEENKKTENFINISSYKLSNHQRELLKMGPKHIPEGPIDIKDAISKIETAISDMNPTDKSEIRNIAQTKLKKAIKNNKDNIEDIKCLKSLRENKEITCLETDKTGKIVIMDKQDYKNKMLETIKLMDVDILEKDPHTKIQNKLKIILKDGTWPDDKKPNCENRATFTPRIFAKYKDHKEPPTLRPIVSKCEGSTYNLEKYLRNILMEIIPNSEANLNSTNEFISKIKNIKIEEDEIIVSFDIINLYPSINIIEINKIINQAITEKYGNNKIEETLHKAINLVLNNSTFQFDKTYYKQKQGVPMGSPISGSVAEWKLRLMENTIKKDFKNIIKHWYRYVDDIFAIIKQSEKDTILTQLNKLDQNIKFTIELENNRILNFLDVKIIRKEDNTIETTVFRKSTKSNEIINYKCPTPYNYKIAALQSYVNRAINICSNQQLLQEEIKEIEKIAKNADFPKNTVKNILKKRYKKLNENFPDGQPAKMKFTNAIPYMKGVGQKLKYEALKKNIKIPIQPNFNTIKRIKSNKDKIPEEETAGVYRIEFKKIESGEIGSYIGVTRRKIKQRIKEHIKDIEKGKNTTALARLYNEEKIEINFKDIKKLADYTNHKYSFFREGAEIISDVTSCNDMQHCILDNRWRDLLKKNKQTNIAVLTRSNSAPEENT